MHGILPEPLQPNGKCPDCGKAGRLRLVGERADPVVACVRIYRCQKCGKEVEYARSLPRHTV